MTIRPQWQEMFMATAVLWSRRTACLSRRCGAVIVKDHRIVATGYNGPPPGHPHCGECRRKANTSGDNLDDCPAVHAEINAIAYAARAGVSIEGAQIYITAQLCVPCTKAIIIAGLLEIFWLDEYPASPIREKLLQEAGVHITSFGKIVGYSPKNFTSRIIEILSEGNLG